MVGGEHVNIGPAFGADRYDKGSSGYACLVHGDVRRQLDCAMRYEGGSNRQKTDGPGRYSVSARFETHRAAPVYGLSPVPPVQAVANAVRSARRAAVSVVTGRFPLPEQRRPSNGRGDRVTVAARQGLGTVEAVLDDVATLPAHGLVGLRESNAFPALLHPNA